MQPGFRTDPVNAFNDYGIVTNQQLDQEVLAQTNTAGSGSFSSGGGESVKCRCGYKSSGCKADNEGDTCTTSTEACWTYDRNCGSSTNN